MLTRQAYEVWSCTWLRLLVRCFAQMQQPESKPACQDSSTQPLEFRCDGSERQREIYAKMSPREKWEQVCRLREMAWAMKSARIRSQHPDWSEDQIFHEVKKIFLYAVT